MNRKHSFLARGVMAFSILVLAAGCSAPLVAHTS
jgi:hypothetical protein